MTDPAEEALHTGAVQEATPRTPSVTVITGAAGAIGAATARELAARGDVLVLSDRSADALEPLARELVAAGADVTVVPADVSGAAGNEEIVHAAVERYGRVEGVVLAAGIYPEGPLTQTIDEDWRRTLAVNLDSAFYLLRAVAPHLRPAASIVALTSIAGARGSKNHAAYAATKGGLLSLVRSMAWELAPARVNAVAPGVIETTMTQGLRETTAPGLLQQSPLGRFGTAEEVAGVIAFLSSPAAGFVTGEVIHVNGGLHMH